MTPAKKYDEPQVRCTKCGAPIDGWYARTLFTYDPNNPAMQPVIEYLASKGE